MCIFAANKKYNVRMTDQQPRSVYSYAAESGAVMGLYLCLIASCFLFSRHADILSVLIFPLLAGVPFLLARGMKRMSREVEAYAGVTPMWLMGIYTFIFASLIATLFTTAILLFVEQGLLYNMIQSGIEELKAHNANGSFTRHIELGNMAIEKHLIPTPLDFSLTMAWSTSFAGSIISLATAWILTRRSRPKINMIS